MNWWDRMWSNRIAAGDTASMPKVKPPKREPDPNNNVLDYINAKQEWCGDRVGEPVWSFLRCWAKKPQRFKIVKVRDAWDDEIDKIRINTRQKISRVYTVTDKFTKEKFTIHYEYTYGCEPYITIDECLWLKWDEKQVLYDVVKTWSSKLHTQRQQRVADRKSRTERKRLENIYRG